jgi:hypothetical protein
MILVYRRKTGCRQYVFEEYREMVIFFSKPCYEGEEFLVAEYNDEGRVKKRFMTSTDNFMYGCGVQLDLLSAVEH